MTVEVDGAEVETGHGGRAYVGVLGRTTALQNRLHGSPVMDDYHPDQASTSGEEGPEFVWARVSPEDLAWVKTLEVRSGFPKRSRQRDLSPVQSDKTVVTVSEFARLLHVFAHMVERSAQSEDAPAPKAVRVRKVKAMTEPASPPG